MMNLNKDIEYKKPLFGSEEEDNNDESGNLGIILKAKIHKNTISLGVRTLIDYLEDGDDFIIPEFQRRFVWNKNQVAKLALSLIKDFPIPPIYTYEKNGANVVLDGQQRITAMFLYLNDLEYKGIYPYKRIEFKNVKAINKELISCEENLAKAKKEKAGKAEIAKYTQRKKELEKKLKDKYGVTRTKYKILDGDGADVDITFSRLETSEKKIIEKRGITITNIESQDNQRSRTYAEIFKLLNSAGKLLGTQEIRNGVYYDAALYKMLVQINQNQNWRAIYGKKESLYSKDVELLLKMISLDYFTEIGTINDGEQGAKEGVKIAFKKSFSWSNIMEEYSEKFKSTQMEQTVKEAGCKLSNYLDCIKDINTRKKCNKAVFEAVFVAYCKIGKPYEIDYNWLCSLEGETEFKKGNVLSNKSSVQGRLTKAWEKLKELYDVESRGDC